MCRTQGRAPVAAEAAVGGEEEAEERWRGEGSSRAVLRGRCPAVRQRRGREGEVCHQSSRSSGRGWHAILPGVLAGVVRVGAGGGAAVVGVGRGGPHAARPVRGMETGGWKSRRRDDVATAVMTSLLTSRRGRRRTRSLR